MVVNQVTKSGGKLGFLLTNFFHSLASNTTDIDEAFIVPHSTVANVQLAIQQRNEDALLAFLKTGSAASPPQSDAPIIRTAVVASTIQASRFKVEELALSQPPVVMVAAVASNREGPVSQPSASTNTAAVSPTALSKESKMEMWKRITEERKVAQEKEKERLQRELTKGQDNATAEASQTRSCDANSSPNTVVEPAPILPFKLPSAQAIHRTVEDPSMKSPPPLPPSPPAVPTHAGHLQQKDRITVAVAPQKPRTTVRTGELRGGDEVGREGTLTADSLSNFAGQVKVLTEQVATMRKYMKVSRWCKCGKGSK